MTEAHDLPDVSGYGRSRVVISALVGLVVTGIAYWWAQNFYVGVESTSRVGPTVESGGIGSAWVSGNTEPLMDFLIALIHAADVIMGAFILLMVFLHWAAFRRLADQMRQPGEGSAEAIAADGGSTEQASGDATGGVADE